MFCEMHWAISSSNRIVYLHKPRCYIHRQWNRIESSGRNPCIGDLIIFDTGVQWGKESFSSSGPKKSE